MLTATLFSLGGDTRFSQAVYWFDLILLFYFISAVEAVFAYQADGLSVAGLTLVVTLFISCMLYIRYRGRETRLAAG